MNELKCLLRRKATSIVCIDSETDESASGHVETTTQTYACRIDGQPFELITARTTNFLKHSSAGGSIISEKPITEDQYNQRTANKQPLDTPEALAKIARAHQLQEKKNSLIPKCPKCARVMVEKSGTRGDFWSCPLWNKCGGTREMSQEYKLIRQELSKL